MQSATAAVSCLLFFAAVQASAAEAVGPTCTKKSTKEDKFDCSKTGCCEDASLTCFLKDHTWGECLADCAKGKHADDPKEFRTAWSCSQAARGKKGEVLVKEYGQCGGMLAGQGETPYEGPKTCEEGCRCMKQNKWISSCRPRVNGVACGGKNMTRVGKAVVSNVFKINDKIQAMFAGLWYNAKIDEIHEDGSYRVSWATDNFLTATTVERKQLRHMKEEKFDDVDEEEDDDTETDDDGDLQEKVLSDAIPAGDNSLASTRVAPMGRWAIMSSAALMVLASVALAMKRKLSSVPPLQFSDRAVYERTPELDADGESAAAAC